MSAFLCSDFHIATIAHAVVILSNTMQDYDTSVERLANELKALNIHSINYRYRQNDDENEPCDISKYDERVITVHNLGSFKIPQIDPDKFDKLVRCYLYQSCEHDTEAYNKTFDLLNSFSKRLRGDYNRAKDYPWGIE